MNDDFDLSAVGVDFIEMIKRVRESGKTHMLFTNGMIKELDDGVEYCFTITRRKSDVFLEYVCYPYSPWVTALKIFERLEEEQGDN